MRVDQADAVHLCAAEDFRDHVVQRANGDHRYPTEGAWHKLRSDPILRFLVVSLAFYGMSPFEGPMMAIKTVNALSHYTDWTIGHVHAGALGWVAMISIGALYHLSLIHISEPTRPY